MEIEVEVGKYYKTRDGSKVDITVVEFGYVRGFIFGCSDYTEWTLSGNVYHAEDFGNDKHDLIAPWEDEPEKEKEEIDVANMWVAVRGGEWGFDIYHYTYKDRDSFHKLVRDSYLAIVTVSDWQDICSGKRKLIVGEGL